MVFLVCYNAFLFYLSHLFEASILSFLYQSVSKDYFIAILHIFVFYVVYGCFVILFCRSPSLLNV